MTPSTVLSLAVVIVAVLGTIACLPSAAVRNVDPFQRIQAENYDYVRIATTLRDCPDPLVAYVGGISPGAVVGYFGVDFGAGAEVVEISVAAYDNSGVIHLHLDDPANEPFASIAIQTVDQTDHCNFFSTVDFVKTVPAGVHTLYMTFDVTSIDGFVNIDWFIFRVT